MSLLHSIAFGVIQGFTEFLPISSSGHLVLLPWFFGWKDPGLGFNVALHWGTLVGVVAYYRRDVAELIIGFSQSLTGRRDPQHQFPLKIAVATIPGAVAGALLDDWAETVFRSPWIVAAMLFGVGFILLIADRRGGDDRGVLDISWTSAIIIGCAQAIAIVPGTSRSGITIATALFMGFNRSTAVKFSFLLSIPIIAGAGVFKLGYFVHHLNDVMFWVGIISSALSGFTAIWFLVRYVRVGTFRPFVVYRWLLAVLIVGMLISA